MGRSMSQRKLSSIELTVLGLAWLRGPCTTYAIMKELSMSASTFHKSRAGTAYSIAKRMVRFGYLELSDPASKSPDSLVKITEEGIVQLRDWLTPPIPLPDIAHSADLLRLRFFFLGVVEQDKRLEFIDDSLKVMQNFLRQCEALISANQELGDYFGALATLSMVLEIKARITWLTTVRKWVEDPLTPDIDWAQVLLAEN
jgi:DNA-binding PadR family transcriptional regulator